MELSIKTTQFTIRLFVNIKIKVKFELRYNYFILLYFIFSLQTPALRSPGRLEIRLIKNQNYTLRCVSADDCAPP